MTIIDLGEIVIAHPFFSLLNGLQKIPVIINDIKRDPMSRPRAINLSSSSALESKHSEDTLAVAPLVITDADNDLPPDLMNIVFDYMNSTPLYGPTLFSNLSKPYDAQAKLAAFYFLSGDKAKADELVDENPAILSCVIETKDRLGHRVKGTLLQLAAMYGSFNIHETTIPHKDYGLVERWSRHLPAKEALQQLEAVGPLSWSSKRMQMVKDAITDFLTEISHVPRDDYDSLKIILAPSIEKFRRAVRPDPNNVITKGYIFDPQILSIALELLEKNIDSLGGWWDKRADIFAILGFGFLQSCASIEDLKVLKRDPNYVFDHGETPDDALSFVPGTANSLSGLGENFFLNAFGIKQARWWVVSPICNLRNANRVITKLCTDKNSSVAMCYTTPRQLRQEESVSNPVAFFNNPAATPTAGEGSQQALINHQSNW